MTEDIFIPDVRTVHGVTFQKRTITGRPKGDRLSYRWKQRPYAHQVQAVKKLLSTGFGGALLMEPRTGKTKVAIDYACIQHLKGRINRVLVFCPVGVIGVWEEQLAANVPDEIKYRVTRWDKHGRRNNLLPRFGQDILDFVIVNYDAMAIPGAILRKDEEGNPIRSKSRGGRFTFKKKLKAWQPELVILDESHRIKSPSARKTTAIHSFRDAPFRVIMTGTVVTKKKRIFDIYSQWKFLNEERFRSMNFSDFKNYFGSWKAIPDQNWSKFIGPKNERQLHRLVHLDAFSIRRDECYDLPKMTRQIIPIELQPEGSAKIYDQMAEDMVARIRTGEITEASIPLVQQLRLQQITSGIARTSPSADYPQGRLVVIGSEKLEALKTRLEDLFEADEKVVIGALFKADLIRIEKLVAKMKMPYFVVKGGVKPRDRDYARQEFARVSGGAAFIGQPAAAGEGIDLSAASIMIWYSLTPSWVNFTQFSDRIALSDRPTFHEYLLASRTIDELRYQGLQEDEDIGKWIITSPERLLRERGSLTLR